MVLFPPCGLTLVCYSRLAVLCVLKFSLLIFFCLFLPVLCFASFLSCCSFSFLYFPLLCSFPCLCSALLLSLSLLCFPLLSCALLLFFPVFLSCACFCSFLFLCSFSFLSLCSTLLLSFPVLCFTPFFGWKLLEFIRDATVLKTLCLQQPKDV